MHKYEDTKNGYLIDSTSTSEQFRKIATEYDTFKCVICNSETAKCFSFGFLSRGNGLTINNSVPDNVFYINRVC